jgi:predicted 3-demethylubiquinone-9 3-methyltransferase (glyoxalase superfamily)
MTKREQRIGLKSAKGSVMIIDFEVDSQQFTALNAGPELHRGAYAT